MDVQIACVCTAGHDTDTVTLRERLDFRAATAIRNSVAFAKLEDPDIGTGELLAILTEGYLLHGIEAWTLTDEKGKPIAVSKPEIRARLLADPLLAEAIGEAADALYQPAILGPLVNRALTSSNTSPTAASTSASRASGTKRPKPPKPSSTTTIQTGGTATITSLPGGVSSSSPSSASAA